MKQFTTIYGIYHNHHKQQGFNLIDWELSHSSHFTVLFTHHIFFLLIDHILTYPLVILEYSELKLWIYGLHTLVCLLVDVISGTEVNQWLYLSSKTVEENPRFNPAVEDGERILSDKTILSEILLTLCSFIGQIFKHSWWVMLYKRGQLPSKSLFHQGDNLPDSIKSTWLIPWIWRSFIFIGKRPRTYSITYQSSQLFLRWSLFIFPILKWHIRAREQHSCSWSSGLMNDSRIEWMNEWMMR